MGESISQGKQHSFTTNSGNSLSISWRLLHYSISEEKELLAQEVRSLEARFFYLNIGNQTIKVHSADCLRLPTVYGKHDFLKILWNYHHLPKPKDGKINLELENFPSTEMKESKIYPTLSTDRPIEDFSHFFDMDTDEDL